MNYIGLKQVDKNMRAKIIKYWQDHKDNSAAVISEVFGVKKHSVDRIIDTHLESKKQVFEKEIKVHELKTWKEYFVEIWAGRKKWELRKNDRNFNVGDRLLLREYDNLSYKYTGLDLLVDVVFILEGGKFGLEEGFCIMSIEKTVKTK